MAARPALTPEINRVSAYAKWQTRILGLLALAGSAVVFAYWTALDEATLPLYTAAAPRGLQSLTLFSDRQRAQQILDDWKKTTVADAAKTVAADAAKEQGALRRHPIRDRIAQLSETGNCRLDRCGGARESAEDVT
jgi:hypothetical protein